jgi:hypothetical protein
LKIARHIGSGLGLAVGIAVWGLSFAPALAQGEATAIAEAPEPPPPPPKLDAALNLPVRIGAPWRATQDQLYGMRCMAEDSPLFEAMDCRSDLALGPFSASGPEGDGLIVYADDGATVSRVSASRATAARRASCDPFIASAARSLTALGKQSSVTRVAGGLRLQTAADDDLRLRLDCRPEAQTLELADAWIDIVPGGSCPGLEAAPSDLRAVADSAMTKVVHAETDDLGTACNRPAFPVHTFPARMMEGVVVAYLSLGRAVPSAPPIGSRIRFAPGSPMPAREALPSPPPVAAASRLTSIGSRARSTFARSGPV